nr:FAD-dependent oxidoreductase [Mycobacterium sp. 852014-50255_SCH5639931]
MIVIVCAGVCGLAAAYELARRGEPAIVLERGRLSNCTTRTWWSGFVPRHMWDAGNW